MNQHPPGQHLPSCTSPDNCAEFRALLSMSESEYAAWLKKQDGGIRLASRRGQLRTTATRKTLRASCATPPNPYADGVKALRRANGYAEVQPDFDPNYRPGTGTAPDGHGIGIALRRLAETPMTLDDVRKMKTAAVKDTENLGGYAAGVRALRKENQ